MKKNLINILLVFFPVLSMAQLHTLSDQYIFNGLAINPAYAGSEEALSASLIYRNQWIGFKGSPKTLTGSIHSPLGSERVALGLLVVNDQIGVNSETSIMGNYAYMIEMGEGKISLGVGVGVMLLDVDWNKLEATDFNDLELLNSSEKLTNPNFSAGIYYHSKKLFYGISIPFFLSYTYSETTKKIELKNDISQYNYHVIGGYTFDVTSNLKLQPSMLIKYHAGNALQTDLSSMFILDDRFWLGLTFRSNDAIASILQIAVTNQFKIAYSYDFDISKTGSYHRSSHEVMLKYALDFRARVVGPKRF